MADTIGVDPADRKGDWSTISTYTNNPIQVTAKQIEDMMQDVALHRIRETTLLARNDSGQFIVWHPPLVTVGQALGPAHFSFADLYRNDPFVHPNHLRFTDVTGADDYLHGFYRKMDADGEITDPLVLLFIAETLEMQGKPRHALAWQWIYNQQRRPRKRQSMRIVSDQHYWEWSYRYMTYHAEDLHGNWIPIQVFGHLQTDHSLREAYTGRGHYRLLSKAYRDLVEACIVTPRFEPLNPPLVPFQE